MVVVNLPLDPTQPAFWTFVFALVYAVVGYWEGVKTNKESFDGISFAKTVIIALVTSGYLSQTTANSTIEFVTQFGSITGANLALDRAVNSFLAGRRVSPPPAPQPSPTT